MDIALSAARLLLAAVLLAAALGKLLDRDGSRRALLGFGVAPRLVPSAVVALPLVEAALAAALLLTPSARLGALGAALLFTAFTVGMTRAFRAGRTLDCHCFGALHSEPVGIRGIVRNVLLVAVALTVAASADQPTLAWPLVAAPVVVVGALAVGRTRHARAAQRALLAPDTPVVIAVVDGGCPPCRALLPDLARWQQSLSRDLPVRVVATGDAAAYRSLAAEHGLGDMVVDGDPGLVARFGIRGTPSAVLVHPDGKVGSEPATGAVAIEALIRQALQRATARPAVFSHAAMNSRP